jgi:hypothetical protein
MIVFNMQNTHVFIFFFSAQTVASIPGSRQLTRSIRSVFVDSRGTPIYCGGAYREEEDPAFAGCFRLTPEVVPRAPAGDTPGTSAAAAATAAALLPGGSERESLSNIRASGDATLTYTDPETLLNVTSPMVGWG